MTPYQQTFRCAAKRAAEEVRWNDRAIGRWRALKLRYPTVPEVGYGPVDAYVDLLSVKYGGIDLQEHIKPGWTIADLDALAQEIAVIRALEAG